jgi:hypothetical protein
MPHPTVGRTQSCGLSLTVFDGEPLATLCQLGWVDGWMQRRAEAETQRLSYFTVVAQPACADPPDNTSTCALSISGAISWRHRRTSPVAPPPTKRPIWEATQFCFQPPPRCSPPASTRSTALPPRSARWAWLVPPYRVTPIPARRCRRIDARRALCANQQSSLGPVCRRLILEPVRRNCKPTDEGILDRLPRLASIRVARRCAFTPGSPSSTANGCDSPSRRPDRPGLAQGESASKPHRTS